MASKSYLVYVEIKRGASWEMLADRQLTASRPDVAVSRVLQSLGVVSRGRFEGYRAPVKLAKGERLRVDVLEAE